MAEIESLKKKVKELEEQLQQLKKKDETKREKIEKMSDVVVDSNPYR